MRKVLMVAGGIGAIGLILVIGVVTGFIYLGVKDPSQKLSVDYRVCDESVVQAYSSKVNTSNSLSSSDLKSIQTMVMQKAHYLDDPTCEYILFQVSFNLHDSSGMSTALSRLQSLEEKGSYPDSRLIGIVDLNTLKLMESADTQGGKVVRGEG